MAAMERSGAGPAAMQADLICSALMISHPRLLSASVSQANKSGCAMCLPSRMMRTIAA